jgi:hypothetical protein
MGNVIRSDDRRWPDGRVPYVIGDGVPEAEVQAAIAQWTNSGAPVSFVPYTGPRSPFAEPYILFVLGDSATACNTVTGRRRPGQRVCPRPVNDPHRRPFTAPLMARVLPADGQISPR